MPDTTVNKIKVPNSLEVNFYWTAAVLSIAMIAVVIVLCIGYLVINTSECYVVNTPEGYALVNANGVISRSDSASNLIAVGNDRKCLKEQ